MSNDIVQINADKIATMTGYSSEEVAIVKATVAKNTTDTELAYFLNVSKSNGLNPFNKETWCYKDNKGNLLVFTGRDGFLAKAQSNPKFNGIRSCEVREGDVFKIDIANNKITHEFTGEQRGKILGAYAIVFRKDGEPTIEYAEMDAYNKGYNTWKTNPAEMIKKVAESHALKKAFGISGIQSEYDFAEKDGVVIPLDTTESEIDLARDKIIEALEVYQGEDKEDIRKRCQVNIKSKKFDMPFAKSIAEQIGIEL